MLEQLHSGRADSAGRAVHEHPRTARLPEQADVPERVVRTLRAHRRLLVAEALRDRRHHPARRDRLVLGVRTPARVVEAEDAIADRERRHSDATASTSPANSQPTVSASAATDPRETDNERFRPKETEVVRFTHCT